MPQAVTELDLHAYIDGELSPERAAAVEAAMAGDPALAERVRDFQADRQALVDTYRRLADAPVPAALLKAASTPPPRRRRIIGFAFVGAAALAACLERFQPDQNRSHAKMGFRNAPQVRFVGLRFSITGGTDALAAWEILFAGSKRGGIRLACPLPDGKQLAGRRRGVLLQPLQDCLDLFVAGSHLGLIDIVQFERLGQSEDVLLPIVANQRLTHRLDGGMAPPVTVGGQDVWVALARHNRANGWCDQRRTVPGLRRAGPGLDAEAGRCRHHGQPEGP